MGADTCSLYQIADDECGQSDLNCDYVKYAKAAEKGLQDGTCADNGHGVQTGTQTKTYPVIGDIVITTYSKGFAVADTCSLYQIADDECGQSDLNCDYVKYAKAAEKGLQDGTCADNGYSVETGTQTKHYPVIGDIVITTYSKAIQAEAAVTGECYCSCCNRCHMSECYDGHSCCDDPTCSGCGHLEDEPEAPEWVKEARAAAAATQV